MGGIEILSIGIGLAMDAFAVSICKGLSMKKIDYKKALVIAIYFGVFQALMPLIGYYFGSYFYETITKIDHWIILTLLSFIGANMIKEGVNKEKESMDDNIDIRTMIILSFATSIDAMAVGITFAFSELNIITTIIIIGIITFLISLLGVIIGNKFGDKFEKRSQILGGILLIIIGIKILFEHIGNL